MPRDHLVRPHKIGDQEGTYPLPEAQVNRFMMKSTTLTSLAKAR